MDWEKCLHRQKERRCIYTHDKCVFTEQTDRRTKGEWIDVKSADVPERALSCCHCTFVL